ncbi:DNA fragmentation factor subunit beta [Biomphalaria glabrata]|nr:DNA fragmentation factor subunit beta [Biomphalaria glabrata]
MLNSITSLINSVKKPLKVRCVAEESFRRYGIVAKDYSDAVKKGKEKLKIPNNVKVTVVLEDDGTEVTDNGYLDTLQPHTTLVFLRPGEYFQPDLLKVVEGLQLLISSIKPEGIKEITQLLKKEESYEKLEMFSQLKEASLINIDAEKRQDDEDWFQGIDKKYKTKTAYMKYLAQRRIRSYFDSAKDQIQEEKDPKVKAELLGIFDKMKTELKKNDQHGHYFDRSSSKQKLCDEKGWFKCEGPFDEDACDQSHMINPYSSKLRRLGFMNWNLDHIIEKKREVIPKLVEAAKKKSGKKQLNHMEVYKLLFTKDNLKFVQYECHKKEARSPTINVDDFYLH